MVGEIVCKFSFRCDRKWDELKVIDGNDKTRFCTVCESPVYMTTTYEQLAENIAKKRCIAIRVPTQFDAESDELSPPTGMDDEYIGMAEPPSISSSRVDPFLTRPIRDILKNAAAVEKLTRRGISLVGYLVQLSEEALIREVSLTSIEVGEVKEALASHGFTVGMTVANWGKLGAASSTLDGYSFSESELKLLTSTFTELGHAKGVETALQMGHGGGFAGVIVEVVRPGSSGFTPVAQIQSAPFNSSVVFSSTSCGDNGQLGPQLAYSTLADAMKYAEIFVGAVVDVDRKNDIDQAVNTDAPGKQRKQEVLTFVETVLLDTVSKQIGVIAKAPGWLEIKDGFMPNAASASVGYSHNGQPVPLGSFVITRESDGKTFCSIRGIDKSSKFPGPDYHPSLKDAVTFSIPYFVEMANKTSRHLNGPWWKRLF